MQQHLRFTVAGPIDHGPLAGLFHPAVADWFTDTFGAPTVVQRGAWRATARRRNALIAAPTGSGKTLAAFLSAINELAVEGIERGLRDEVQVLYVSPLKALSNDIHRNLEAPLAGIGQRLRAMGLADPGIRAAVRTGDTGALERARMRRQPPHILVTTPESLFILLTSDSGRRMLASTKSVIVDELHAVAGSKRGAHLALSLERLAALCATPPLRIGLSATQKPIEMMARLLMGEREAGEGPVDVRPREHPAEAGRAGERSSDAGRAGDGGEKLLDRCVIVDTGHSRQRDLALEIPRSPLTAVMATEVWDEIYDRLAQLANAHRTTLIFVNQRRLAERVARHLAERIGEEHVTSHHGSLAKEHRLHAEQRLKSGRLRALVATASLELGIDIGDVDLVCQLGSPRGINALLQRVGRAGHAVRAIPKGRLFPLSLDDLAECAALLDCVERGELDRVQVPAAPIDVLAQQIAAEAACREWTLDDLYRRFARALPYRELPLERFEAVVRMLADGYSTRRGRRGALLHYDAVHRVLRGRRGARLTAVTNAGTIPDQFDYEVELSPEGLRIGTLNEDFAFESLPGDIVQLGNTSYRICKVETGRVIVEDARGQPPNMPFWFGEAPGRSQELSRAVSRLREHADRVLDGGVEACRDWLCREYRLAPAAAVQLAGYLGAARAALGLLPTREKIVFERFFDEVGDTHLVIHAPLGSRVMRAWGLALRKRFCRQFNFELQAAALDDCLVLSLGPTHSFPLQDVGRFLHSNTAADVLVQAVLQAPMFPTRWRWSASVALAVARNRNGKRVPPQFQRSDAEDLLTHAFPDAVACQDNLPGDREVPEHPLVEQALDDCLHEVMDVDGLLSLLRRIERGAVEIVCRDLTAPSPLSESILNARPYAFLDGGAAEERRTLAVRTRGGGGMWEPESAADLGRLDPAAIERVRDEMRPDPVNVDELHDALVVHGFLTDAETSAWTSWRDALLAARRIVRMTPPGGAPLWVAAERLAELRALLPDAQVHGDAPTLGAAPDADSALRELLRSRLELVGPVTEVELAAPLGAAAGAVGAALLELEQQGSVMRGQFTSSRSPCGGEPMGGENSGASAPLQPERLEWCERRRLARIHRYTRDRRRAEFEPVPPAAFIRFLCEWQGLTDAGRRDGPVALEAVLAQLEGFPVAAGAWEAELLPARMPDYDPAWLDALCASGRLIWQRPPAAGEGRKAGPVRATPILLLPRRQAALWQTAADADPELSAAAAAVLETLDRHGASFFVDLVADSGLLRSQVETALGELVSHGLVTADGFAGLRALLAPAEVKSRRLRRGGLQAAFESLESAGRWVRVSASRPLAAGQPTNAYGTQLSDGPERQRGVRRKDAPNNARPRMVGPGSEPNPAMAPGTAGTEDTDGTGASVVASGLTRPGVGSELAAASRRHDPRSQSTPRTQSSDTGDRASVDDAAPGATTEYIARVLLRRYGVVFRKLIERESRLPPWRELHYVLRRLEARGEIRGGRFVGGFSGEQFALPEAATALRRHREDHDAAPVVVPACDPLNLTGVLLPGERVPALPGNRVLLRAGAVVASLAGGEFKAFARAGAADAWDWENRLRRQPGWTAPPALHGRRAASRRANAGSQADRTDDRPAS